MAKPILSAITVAASLSFLTATAQSANPAPIDRRLVTSVTLEDMRTIVTGYQHTVVEDRADGKGLMVETPTGYRYLIALHACNDAGACQEVAIGALHDLPEGTTWEILNRVDSQLDAFGMYVENDQLVIDRYIILSGGVQVETFKHEIGRLIVVAPATVSGMLQGLEKLAAAEG